MSTASGHHFFGPQRGTLFGSGQVRKSLGHALARVAVAQFEFHGVARTDLRTTKLSRIACGESVTFLTHCTTQPPWSS